LPQPPDQIVAGFGSREFDAEGRYLRADFGNLSVISAYLPSGSSSDERQQAKFRFMREFMPHLAKLKASGREILICGDWNIAHQEIDLKNWRGNQKKLRFPARGAGMAYQGVRRSGLGGCIPAACIRTPPARPIPGGQTAARPGPRTWAGASDYQIATPGIAAKAKKAAIYKAQRFSDHAP